MTSHAARTTTPRTALALVLAALTASCGAPASEPPTRALPAAAAEVATPPAPAAGPWSQQDMLADLETLGDLLQAHWSYLDDKREHLGVDLDAMLATARAALDEPPDAAGWRDVLERFVASMQDGHAGVTVPGAPPPPLAWPITAVPVAEGLAVESVLPATHAAMDTLPGDLVLAVDAVPATDLLGLEMRRTSASTLGARRVHAAARVRLTDRPAARFTMRRPGGPLYELVYDAVPAHQQAPQPERWSDGITWRRLDERTGLLRVGSFSAPDAEAWALAGSEQRDAVLAPLYETIRRAFRELSGVESLVLDLRHNGGGTDLAGQELARHLVAPGSVYFGLQSRRDDGTWLPVTRIRLPAEAPPHAFAGRLVVLIDEHTFSVSDNVCACLDDVHPDVTFVGRPTGGGTGAPRPFTLPRTGASVSFCTMLVERPGGGLIEGRGTTPDVPVTWTGADLAAGRDPDLDAALAFLAGQAAGGR